MVEELAVLSSSDLWLGGSECTDATGDIPLLQHWDGASWRIFHLADMGFSGLRIGGKCRFGLDRQITEWQSAVH